jgi:hypothetical protein
MGWGGFLDKLMGVLPIQKRKERWKNELDNLTKERANLIKGDCDEKKANRVVIIDQRISNLNQLLKNSASD